MGTTTATIFVISSVLVYFLFLSSMNNIKTVEGGFLKTILKQAIKPFQKTKTNPVGESEQIDSQFDVATIADDVEVASKKSQFVLDLSWSKQKQYEELQKGITEKNIPIINDDDLKENIIPWLSNLNALGRAATSDEVITFEMNDKGTTAAHVIVYLRGHRPSEDSKIEVTVLTSAASVVVPKQHTTILQKFQKTRRFKSPKEFTSQHTVERPLNGEEILTLANLP
eukprot:m.5675 g.5675  ORF g.5675 m.5675 type:complete len:226 (+) comp4518_c0_seq1:182-859(+)